MEEYKLKMIEEAKELSKKLFKLDKDIDRFSDDPSFDPIGLALMKQQFEHMSNYYGTLMLRCQFCFTQDEYKILGEKLNDSSRD